MHVIDEVWSDKREGGQGIVGQVRRQLRVGHVEAGTPRQGRVVGRGVVADRVVADVGSVTVGGHGILVGLPGFALGKDAFGVGRAVAGRVTIGGIRVELGDRQARGGGDVVGQAGVGDVVIVRGQPTVVRQTS